MSPIATQIVIVILGLSVLGIAVQAKARVAACVCLGLLLVFGSVSGAILYEQPKQAAAHQSVRFTIDVGDDLIEMSDGTSDLPNITLPNNSMRSVLFQASQDDTDSTKEIERESTASTDGEVALPDPESPDNQSTKVESDSKSPVVEAEQSQVEESNPSATPPRTSSSNDDSEAVPSDSSFIPLDGETVPASVGTMVEGMPEWIAKGDYDTGDVDYRLVTAGPSYRLRDCERELNDLMLQATDEYIDDWLEPGASRYVNFDLKFIKEHLRVEGKRFTHVREYQVGPMHSSYTQLHFDQSFRDQVSHEWRTVKSKHRLIHTGLLGGGVLGLLLTVFGYFRLDHATRGFYTGRLQFLAGGAILVLVLAGAIAWRAIPWL